MLQKQGSDTTIISVPTAIRSTLEGLMRWLVSEGQLPEENTHNEEELEKIYRAMFQDARGAPNFTSLTIQVEPEKSEAPQNLESPTSDDVNPSDPVDLEAITAAVEQRAQQMIESKVLRQSDPIETADIPDIHTDLMSVNRMDIKTLAKIAPKDVLIEKCVKGIVDPIFLTAVEIIYTKLSPDLWGTSTAEGAIQNLIKHHRSV
jgi:hypothetical protein